MIFDLVYEILVVGLPFPPTVPWYSVGADIRFRNC